MKPLEIVAGVRRKLHNTRPMLAKRQALIVALTALAIVSSMFTARPQGVADVRGSIDVNGVTRTYVAHVPPHLGSRVPLVLSFHGHGGSGEQQSRLTHLDALSDKDGFVVIYPDGIRRGWNDGRPQNAGADDIAFTNALIASFSKRYSIDPKRIYATGFSNGGTFAEYLGCMLSDRIAAIAPVSGSLPVPDVQSCHPSRPLPVLTIAGTADPIMPYVGGEIRIMGADRGEVISAQKTASFWAANAKCDSVPRTATLPPVMPSDGTSVQRAAYAGCAHGTDVELYTIQGGGHAWPGGPQYLPKIFIGLASTQLDASARIVDFFLAHPMP